MAFADTITVGTAPITFTRRGSNTNRSVFVPAGDTPQNERKLEIAHEQSASRRVNTLVKVGTARPNPTSLVMEDGGLQLKVVRPASYTEAEVQLWCDWMRSFLTVANITRIYNQER